MRVFLLFLLAALFLAFSAVSDSYSQECTQDIDCGVSDMCMSYLCLGGQCLTSNTICSISAPCLVSQGCDPEFGCVIEPKPDGTACTPFGTLICEDGGLCQEGQCVPQPRDCDDMNECTAEFCDDFLGCQYEQVEDGIACNEGEGVCSAGECVEPACDCGDPDAITKGFKIHNKSVYFGTKYDDIICADGEKNVIFGFSGNDCIDAGAGKDKVFAGPGDDTVFLGAGDDKCWGGSGNDEIDGEDGNDKVWGGPGEDVCYGEKLRSCE